HVDVHGAGDDAAACEFGDRGRARRAGDVPPAERAVQGDVVDAVEVRVRHAVAIELDVVAPHPDGAVAVEHLDAERRAPVAAVGHPFRELTAEIDGAPAPDGGAPAGARRVIDVAQGAAAFAHWVGGGEAAQPGQVLRGDDRLGTGHQPSTPRPPPPEVSTTNASPAKSGYPTALAGIACSSPEGATRTNRPGRPAPPPANPSGPRAMRSPRVSTTASASRRITVRVPLPPCHRPVPPEPSITSTRSMRSGRRASMASTCGTRLRPPPNNPPVASAPSRPCRAPIPPKSNALCTHDPSVPAMEKGWMRPDAATAWSGRACERAR